MTEKAAAQDCTSHLRQIYETCADVCEMAVIAKRLSAFTNCWWALRLEVTPSWMAIEIAAALREAGLQQCGAGAWAGAEHMEHDEGEAQVLSDTLHSTWQTDTKPPSSPATIRANGPMDSVEFAP